MKNLIGLTISLLLTAGAAAAHGLYEPINAADLAAHPEAYHDRQVEFTASIIAISADAKSLELFDTQSGTMITVRLALLQKSQRRALIHTPARNLLVQGRAMVVRGRLVIDAHKAEAPPLVSADDRGNHEETLESARR